MSAPRIQLDSADAIDGRHIPAAAFQQVRLEYGPDEVHRQQLACGSELRQLGAIS
jgi:hypothetical protein